MNEYNFTVMWKDEKIADVIIKNNRRDVTINRYSNDPGKQPFGGNKLDLERVYDFLKERWFEMERPDVSEMLEDLNLDEYNPWKIVKKTHGVMFEDFLWIKFEGEDLLWKDVKIRD